MSLELVRPMSDSKRPVGRPKNRTKFLVWVETQWTGDYVKLSKELGISIQYLESLVAGSRRPSLSLALKIKTLTGGVIDLDALLDPKDRAAA
jgi:hypothetical protein